MKAENSDDRDCPQRDNAEHKGYAEVRRSFRSIWKEKDSAQPELLEKILYMDNPNRAYKRVKANKGAPGIDGITVDEIGAYLRGNQEAIIERIYKWKYTPDLVRRREIPKTDGGMRKLGIPTVKDRIFQQAIAQQLMLIYEGQFSDGSFGYHPGRSAKDAFSKVEEYAEEGYRYALRGTKVSSGTISNLNKKTYEYIEDWCNQPLNGGNYPYVFVDGIFLKRCWGGEYENVSNSDSHWCKRGRLARNNRLLCW